VKYGALYYAASLFFLNYAAWGQPDPCVVLREFSAASATSEWFPPAESERWANLLSTAADTQPASSCAYGARVKAVMLHSTAGRLNDGITVADAGIAAQLPGGGRASLANYSINMRVRRAGGESPELAAECAPIAQAGLEGFSSIDDLFGTGKLHDIATLLPLHHVVATASGSDATLFALAEQCARMNDVARSAGTSLPAEFDAFSLGREVVLLRLTGLDEPTHARLMECLRLLPWADGTSFTASTLVRSVLGKRDIPLDRRVRLAEAAEQMTTEEGWRIRVAMWMLTPQTLDRPQGDAELLALFGRAEAVRLRAEAFALTLSPGEVPAGFDSVAEWERAVKFTIGQAARVGLVDLQRCDLGRPAAMSFVARYPHESQTALFVRLLADCP